jgi:hypothetical protein
LKVAQLNQQLKNDLSNPIGSNLLCSTKNLIQVKIYPQQSFTDLVENLKLISPIKIKHVSFFAKIARDQQFCYHGWQLIAIEIDWDLI